MRQSVFGLITLVLASSGCGNQSPPAPKAPSNASATTASTTAPWTEEKKRVAEISRKAVGANATLFAKQSKIGKPFKHDDGTWSVVISSIPAVPGGEAYVDIDSNEKVIRITGGL